MDHMIKMKKQSVTKEIPATEYEKIRRYLIGEIVKSGDTPKRLESTRDLAKRFDVSRTTVLKAMKDLVDDGFITAKPGRLGAFTCPHRIRGRGDSRIIGLLSGDGKNVFVTRIQSRFLYEFGDAMQRRSDRYLIQNIFLCGIKSEAAKEICELGLSAVIWIQPLSGMKATIEELNKRKMPQICIGSYKRECENTYVVFNAEEEYFEASKLMLQEGRKRILLLQQRDELHSEKAVRGWRRAHEIMNMKPDESLLFTESPELEKDFGKILADRSPDGICFACPIGPYFNVVKENYDIREQLRIYSFYCNLSASQENYTGYVGTMNLDEAVKQASENLDAQINGHKAAPILEIPLKAEIKFIDTSKDALP